MSLCKHQRFRKLSTARHWCAAQKKKHNKNYEIYFCNKCYHWSARKAIPSQEDPKQPKDCRRKIRYKTHEDAQKQADWHNTHGDSWVGVYECSYCEGYHVGHMPISLREQILNKVIKIGRDALKREDDDDDRPTRWDALKEWTG